MSITLSALQKQRRDTAANWTAENPTLLAGEIGIESDTGKIKIGNGSTAWTSLAYQGIIPSSGAYPLSQLLMPSGTVSAPSISFDGDNTGIYSPGADQVAISTNGTGRLTIDASGNVNIDSNTLYVDATNNRVGLGTSSVGAKLDVVETYATSALLVRHSGTTGGGAAINVTNGQTSTTPIYGFYYNGTTGIGNPAANVISAIIDGSERLRIDSAGRVGIGNTSPQRNLDVNGSGYQSIRARTTDTSGSNVAELCATYAGGGGGIYTSVLLRAGDGYTFLTSDTSTPLLFGIAATERARIDSSGRLLVGTSYARGFFNGTFQTGVQFETGRSLSVLSNDSDGGTGPAIVLAHQKSGSNGGHTAVANNDALGGISFQGSNGSNFLQGAEIGAFVDGAVSGGGALDLPTRLVFSVTTDGQASPSEAMRITNGRRVYIGTTTGVIDTANFGTVIYNNGYFSAAGNFNGTQELARWFGNAGSVRFLGDGDVENTNNSYGALSDIKLKENVVTAGSQWDDIKALQVRKYNLKAETGYSTHTQLGLIAQEVELVSPGLVGESPDRDAEGNDLGTVTKSVNYSVLYMKAVKALQEAMERIEVLEQRLSDAGIA